MKNFFLAIVALLFISSGIMAQEKGTPKNNKASRTKKFIQEKAGRPDVPGDLTLEIGYNYVQDAPEDVEFRLGGSRTFNVYYQYDINIGESPFSFHPGIGVGTEKYAFKDDLTLGYGTDGVEVVDLEDVIGDLDFKKSQINANYLDIPLELRWRSRKYDPKRSVKVSVGGKVGLLFDSKTKVKYREDNQWKVQKQKDNFELSKVRYGVYGKLGIGGIGLYYYYSLSDTFIKEKGPLDTTMYPMTFGITFALF